MCSVIYWLARTMSTRRNMARRKVSHQAEINSYNYGIDFDSDYEDIDIDSDNEDLDVDSENEGMGKSLYKYIIYYITYTIFHMKT